MKIPEDKVKHLIAGFLISIVTVPVSISISFALVLLIAAGKEVYDIKYGTVDFYDFLATVLGSVLVLSTRLVF